MSRRWLSAGIAGALALTGVTALTTALGAAGPAAAVAAPVACPTALPTASAVDGLTGTGYTVSKGTTPEPFTATVLGRITDGIAPGIDMIMAELDSAAIRKAGVWAGMSGSPVYTEDGRLIGAVAYGLSFAPSPIAGITPAADMQKVLARPSAAASGAARAKVAVSKGVAARLAATKAVTRAQAAGGFSRLTLPVTVSGIGGTTDAGTRKLLDRLGKDMPGTRLMAGAAAPGSGSKAEEITAGGNFTAAVSYGDATLAGTGTTTAVCDGKAVAFGHPFLFSGTSGMSVHPASAVYVQTDSVFGSFKVANPGGPVGTLDQDRLAGIRGVLGKAPTTALITSKLTVPGQGGRTGTTRLVYQPFAGDAAAFHTLFNINRLADQVGAGSADFRLQVRGVRANGSSFTVDRSDSLVDRSDIAFATADSVYGIVSAIAGQPFEKVRITSVTLTGTVRPDPRAYRVDSLRVKQGTKYVDPDGRVITVKAGSKLAVRLRLAPVGGGTARNLDLALPAPAKLKGDSGMVVVSTGPAYLDAEKVQSFPELLAAIKALPTGNSGRAELMTFEKSADSVSRTTKTADRAIQEFEGFFDVEVK